VAPAAVTLRDGRVLLAGGDGSAIAEKPLASAEIFDPKTLAFTTIGSMSAPRVGDTATRLLDGRVLLAGGDGGSAEILDPTTGKFQSVGEMKASRTGPATATLLLDGRVLIAGGGSGSDATSAEIFQP
jgi:hypothetical protein